jgi:hypothetical protein
MGVEAMEDKPGVNEARALNLSLVGSGRSKAAVWQMLWFVLHLAGIYVIVNFCTVPLSAWIRETVLPVLHHPTSSGHFEFLFSHLFAFSFIPGFATGLVNTGLKQKAAQFVWLVPAAALAYKFATFPASSVMQSRFHQAMHWYFGGQFVIPEFYNWREFWSIVYSNRDMTRGMAQLNFTAPFYASVGYSIAAWIARQTQIKRRFVEKFEQWEELRFGS